MSILLIYTKSTVINNINSVLPRGSGHRITYVILRCRNSMRMLPEKEGTLDVT